MYKFRPYEATDLFRAVWRRKDREELRQMGVGAQQRLAEYYAKGPSFTLLHDHMIVACGGVIDIWPGFGEAWFRGTNLIYEHKDYLKKVVFKTFQGLKNNKYRRIQSAVQEDWITARRFAEFLGMKSEGRMPFYGFKGEHFVRYAITDEE